ncbi:MAG: radical SAM protein [Nanoarchaeota archaeon]
MERGMVAIVKPTNSCNLACTYCYTSPTAHRGFMTTETMRNIVTKVTRFNGRNRESHFVWHGGEPTLAGQGFYEDVIAAERKLLDEGYHIVNNMMTNATNLTTDFARFLLKNGFALATSIDGTAFYHNQTRHTPAGEGTFDQVLKTVKLLQEAGQRIGAIVVLNGMNLDGLDETYEFYRDQNIEMKINAVFRAGSARGNWDRISLTPRQYGEALNHIFDRWIIDERATIEVEPVINMMRMLLVDRPEECVHEQACQEYFMSVDPLGNVYPCGRFDGIARFRYGNVNTQQIEDILRSPIRDELLHRSEGLNGCNECDYGHICYGGCMENAFNDDDVMKKDPYCATYKMVFGHISDFLRDALAGTAPLPETTRDKIVNVLGQTVAVEHVDNAKLRKVLSNIATEQIEIHDYGPEWGWKEYRRYADYHRYGDYSEYRESR